MYPGMMVLAVGSIPAHPLMEDATGWTEPTDPTIETRNVPADDERVLEVPDAALDAEAHEAPWEFCATDYEEEP